MSDREMDKREFNVRVMVPKTKGVGWEMRMVKVEATNADAARRLVTVQLNKELGSANWRWL